MIVEILVCSTGDTWDVIATDEHGVAVDEPEWCEKKSEAMRTARKMFRETPSARRLLAEPKAPGVFKLVRER
jgi:hypothetical protein